MRSSCVALVLVVATVAACTSSAPDAAAPSGSPHAAATPVTDAPAPTAAAPDTVTTTALDGNRVAPGRLDLATGAQRLTTSFTVTTVLAAPVAGGHLLVATDGDRVAAWVVGDTVRPLAPEAVARLGTPGAGRPALHRGATGWTFAPGAGPGDADWLTPAGAVVRDGGRVRFGAAVVEDVLPDARWAVDGTRLVVPVRPTEEYGHGVLGDVVEAAGLAVADAASGRVEVVDLPDGTVLEGLGVVLADVDGDGGSDPAVTLSDPVAGARQAVLLDGAFVLGPAVGQGDRWRHLLGVHDGRLIEVVTPHLGRVLQVLRLDADRLVVDVTVPGTIASHRIGSRDLDLAGLVDATGDGRPDVVGPAADDPTVLRVHDGGDGTLVGEVDLGATQSSGLALLPRTDGTTVAAVGLDGGGIVLVGRSE